MFLKVISEQMKKLAIPYEFGEGTADIVYPDTVGEYLEPEPITEDGASEISFILTGTNRGDFITLEELKKKVKKHFHPVNGYRASVDGATIAVFYAGAFPVPTGEAGLKRIQINLKIKVWEGAI